jgi:hypothetical protein
MKLYFKTDDKFGKNSITPCPFKEKLTIGSRGCQTCEENVYTNIHDNWVDCANLKGDKQ